MIRAYFRNAGILSFAQIVAALKGLVLLPLLTHKFGTINYGAWAQVSVLVTLLPPVIVLGTDSGVVRFLPGQDIDRQRREFAGWVYAMAGLGACVCLALALARAPVAKIFFGEAGQYERLVPLAAASIWAALLVYAAQTWYRIRNDAVRLAAIIIAQAALALVGTLVMLVAHQGVYDLVLYLLLGNILIAVPVLTRVLVVRRVRPDFSPLRRYVRFGLPLLPAGYAVWALNWLDRVFLVAYGTLADVGIYSVAYGLAYMVFQTVVNPIYAMYPNLASELYNKGDYAGVQRLFERTAGAILFITVPVIAGSAILGPDLLHLLAPPSFAAAAPVLPIVMGGYLCFMLAAYYETAFGLILKPALASVPIVVACVLNVALNFALIPPYGYIGAALATSAAFVLQLLVALAMVHRREVLITPFPYVIKVLLAGVLTALLLGVLMHLVDLGTAGNLVVGTVFGALVYTAPCLGLRVIPSVATAYAADGGRYLARPLRRIPWIRDATGSPR